MRVTRDVVSNLAIDHVLRLLLLMQSQPAGLLYLHQASHATCALAQVCLPSAIQFGL